ncbi:helix-turn-helix domain-containing protein [Thalassotalea marina]|uniref:AraC family transcriptional regulator n=1 Tax=Thalassotalea marina TaxID=1673741 RepID=A0A919BM23_9GAMM|nr:helix-turn-helix transcriptional regulator [Thalassotalea marina]GHG00369.1 AraC family transcriptional regulator [Thalassotalea marina]
MTAKLDKDPKRFNIQHRQIPALAGVSLYQHPKTQLLFVLQGVLAVITLSGRYIVPAGHGILIPANVKHELIAKTDAELVGLYFSQTAIEQWLNEPRVLQGSKFFNAMMLESLNLPQPEQMLARHCTLVELIEYYLEQLPVRDTYLPYPQHEKLMVIVERILKHPALKSDLVSWGKFVNLSARTLTRRFKQETGLTYSQWRKRLNVQVAIKHLAQGDDIANIASLLGYDSSSAFIFMFRQQVGLSPKQFLKSLSL